MKKSLLTAVVLTAALGIAGCSETNTVRPQIADTDLIATNHNAAESLLNLSSANLSKSQPVLVASFVDVDNLDSSSTFGRITSEQIASKLSQSGYPVIELKLRNNVFIKEQSGEFILSRELVNLSTEHDAQAVLAGTYAVGTNSVWVTSKLIRTTDGVILSSYDYVLPMGPDTRALLRNSR
jgi:TolB-like protein